jgi:hypothetical protein
MMQCKRGNNCCFFLAPGLQKSDFENVSETNCWGEKTHSVEEGKQCAKERKGEKKRVVIFVIVAQQPNLGSVATCSGTRHILR